MPYQTLKTIVALINYGGRVTDDKDVRLITAILKRYFCPELMDPAYRYTNSDVYYPPEAEHVNEVIAYIDDLPRDETPEVFGLHSNAGITFNQ